MTTSDTPKAPDLVLSKLAEEVKSKRPEPYVLVLPSGKRVTFKYPLTYKRSERQTFGKEIIDALRAYDDEPLLRRMLSDEDYAKYDEEDLDDDLNMAVLEKLGEHFQFKKHLEAQGKANASDLL